MEPFIDYRERLADGPFDCIIADIPWGYQTRLGGHMRGLVNYPTFTPDDYGPMLEAFATALHPDRNLWIWTDWYNLPYLLQAAPIAGLTYRALCAMKRVNLGLGQITRKQLYYLPLFSKGKAYKNPSASLSEWLGEYQVTRSAKPQAVYDKLVAHSLPPGGRWIDPFPATHTDCQPGPGGVVLERLRMF